MRLGEAIEILKSGGAVSEPRDFVLREAAASANSLAWSGQTSAALQTCSRLMLDYLPAFERNPALARLLMETLVLCRAHGPLQRLIKALFGVEVTFMGQVAGGPDALCFAAGSHDGKYYVNVSAFDPRGVDCAAAKAQIRAWCDRLFEFLSEA